MQSISSWELIIINDASNDNSLEKIKKLKKNYKNIILINNKKNLGPGMSRTIGLRLSRGKYIAFIDSDDEWKKNKLRNQISFMKNNQILFCHTKVLYKDKKKIKKRFFHLDKKIDFKGLLFNNQITTSSVCIKKSIIKKNDLKFNNFGYDDYSFWLKLLRKVDYCYLFEDYVTIYNTTYNKLSRNKLRSLKWIWHIYFKQNKLGFYKSIFYCIVNIYFTLLKKSLYVKK